MYSPVCQCTQNKKTYRVHLIMDAACSHGIHACIHAYACMHSSISPVIDHAIFICLLSLLSPLLTCQVRTLCQPGLGPLRFTAMRRCLRRQLLCTYVMAYSVYSTWLVADPFVVVHLRLLFSIVSLCDEQLLPTVFSSSPCVTQSGFAAA